MRGSDSRVMMMNHNLINFTYPFLKYGSSGYSVKVTLDENKNQNKKYRAAKKSLSWEKVIFVAY